MKDELVSIGRGLPLLFLVGSVLLQGCAAMNQTEESDSEPAGPPEAAVMSEAPINMELFIYQDDDASKVSKKTTEPRKGYIVEFALNKQPGAEQAPAKVQYRD